ncbi:outer membrane beta-barrel family protein [Nibrella saemangeumensis]|uniref:Outer membrane beta-barrel family protein n=1 Tax=Nibrella saemangeumensis TaxID=1084526 RepID=A0ABP8NJK3_9BACT
MNILKYLIPLGILLFWVAGAARAQEIPSKPIDSTQRVSPPPIRPDTTQLNSADRLDTVRTQTAPAVERAIDISQPLATPQPTALPERSPSTERTESSARIGKVSGRLMAIQSGKNLPVEFASVGVFRTRDSSTVAGALTDERGYFQLEGLPPGNYYILIQSLGFEAKRLPSVAISVQKPEVELGNVVMNESVRQLQEVVVQGQKQLMDYSLDRKIVNVDQLPTALGGSAVDILQNVPSVTVDVDGTLSLRGSSNVIILIDGKPSGLTGLDRQAVLEQIPASNIERVELITNPSARFDADGAAGIINIVLKKERAQGFNGNVQMNVGTRDKYNASVNLNYRLKKVNLFGSYNFRHDRRFSFRNSERQNFFEDSTSYLVQRNDGFRVGNNHNARVGLDYSLTPRDNVTASILYRTDRDRNPSTEVINSLDRNRDLLGRLIRTSEEREPESGFDYTFGYRRKFPKQGRELNFDATLSTNKGTEFTDYSLSTTLPENLLTPNLRIGQQRSTNAEDNRVGVLQLDFVEPMKDKKRFEAGLKYTARLLGADYVFNDQLNGVFVRNEAISNNFVYDERTSAAYVNFGNEFKKISYQVGLRTEYTAITTDQLTTGQRNTRDYIYLFPSAFLNYNVSQAQKMQVNYTRRINRPWVRALNPFIDLTDPLNISFGNPNLNPELINSFELSHLWYGKTTSLTSSLFFRQTNNSITRYRTLRPDGVTEQTSLNLNRAQNYGVEIVLSQEILKWWKVNGNFTFFQANIQPGPGVPEALSRTNQSWTARLNSSLSPRKGTDMQVAVNYRSPFIVAQGTIQGFFNVDFGVKQEVLKGRGTVNFRISDIFNTLQFRSETFGSNFTAVSRNKRETRIAFIGFSYRLSKQVFRDRERKDREEREGSEDNDF